MRNAVVWAATKIASNTCIPDDVLSVIDDEELTSMKQMNNHITDDKLTALLHSIDSKLDLIIKELGL